jgi:3-oxoacyl-[acyl-carrier protein] reductase
MDLGLQNKRAFIAGSSSGLGYAAARELSREGCRVVLNGRSRDSLEAAAEELQSETGSQVYTAQGDVSDPEVPADLIEQAGQHLGGLDLLITNSGGPPPGAFENIPENEWQQAVDLVFLSHVRLIRAALPYLRESDQASVLTVTSVSVKQPIPNLVLSNSVRGATIGLTKTLALELGPDGIRFNSILPGWTRTSRVIELLTDQAERNNTSVEEEIQKRSEETPLGRMAEPEEFGRAAAFLISPAASYLTGVMLTAAGGSYRGTF